MSRNLFAEYRKAFKMLDEDDLGRISIADFSSLVTSVGVQIPDPDVHAIVRNVLGYHDNVPTTTVKCIDFPQFLSALSATITDCISDDEIQRIFREFDKDGDGFISPQELRALLLRLGDDVTENEIQEMIRVADIDGDGRVSLNEFIQVMTTSTPIQQGHDYDVTINKAWSTESVSSSASNNGPRDVFTNSPNDKFDDDIFFPTHDVISAPSSPGSVSLPTSGTFFENGGEFEPKTPQTKRKSSVLAWLKKSRTSKSKSCDNGVLRSSCHNVYGVPQLPQKRGQRWKSLGVIPAFNFKLT